MKTSNESGQEPEQQAADSPKEKVYRFGKPSTTRPGYVEYYEVPESELSQEETASLAHEMWHAFWHMPGLAQEMFISELDRHRKQEQEKAAKAMQSKSRIVGIDGLTFQGGEA